MQYVDMQTWPRRKHFELFNTLDFPHFNLCADIDITSIHKELPRYPFSFTVVIVYALAKAANSITEFRYRIRGGQVVEHDMVHPSPTILCEDDLFSFCTIPFNDDFKNFAAEAEAAIAHIKESSTLDDKPGQDELIYMTSIPWVSFTSFIHPIHMNPVDSIPRIAWGKFFPKGDRTKMPLSVQVHHALADGIHVGRYFNLVQEYLDEPDRFLDV